MYKNIFKDKKRIILEKKRGAMLPGPRRRGSFGNAIFLLFFFLLKFSEISRFLLTLNFLICESRSQNNFLKN